ncbi:MAG: tetratricopeptide repeat protein [Paracoccaceae bacterium]|nr:MAG: tetratricopeptide repeat protein [Paracoccaceae bacterium]
MTEARVQRRLAVVLAADVAGYSRMMGTDEAGTLSALRDVWAKVFNPAVAAREGRVVKTMGDGALVEFGSAVDAVEGAVAVQRAMTAFNAARDGQTPILFRIGINLGDIVIEGSDIFGDGVNVAARLEPLAPKGGLLVSDAVHAQVRGKVPLDFSDAGELVLKNIAAPVRAWAWGGLAGASGVAAAEPEIPSIAVLPFTNMSGDPEQEYFSDGMAEDIITDLSKVGGLIVVARNSSFVYKGRTVDIREVGRDLGVTSVLEGSIRKAGNRVRITAQLIDARTGHHLWADRYDRDMTDIFAVQDEVTMEIVGALKVRLRPVERALLADRGTTNMAAHDLLLRAREHWEKMLHQPSGGRDMFLKVLGMMHEVIDLDPNYARAYAFLSILHTVDLTNRLTDAPDPLGDAARYAALALAKNPEEPLAHNAMAIVALHRKDLDGAQAAAERTIRLNPNFANGYGTLGHILVYRGNPLSAVPHLERAIRLDPVFAQQFLHFMGLAYLVGGQYRTAADTFRERIRVAPQTDLSRAMLASALGHLGEVAAARRTWAELADLNPEYSLDAHLARLPLSPADEARIRDGLAAAGLPGAGV